jgi:Ca2+/Na+ antiporter
MLDFQSSHYGLQWSPFIVFQEKNLYTVYLNFFYGVTFLAFGNGAPDIFSAIAAIGNAKDGDAGLALGALLGKCER